MCQSWVKDEYLLDYINTEELFVRDKDRDERVIERSIINNMKDFIMTFGQDFTFVGNQYHLEKFGVEQFPDLLFFNRERSALVCVDLLCCAQHNRSKRNIRRMLIHAQRASALRAEN